MPKFSGDIDLEKHQGGHFAFHATPLDELMASEYTLATIVCDRSGSTYGFQSSMEKALQASVAALKKSPRADNLLVRVLVFEDSLVEIHGFKLLSTIATDSYNGILHPGGTTALFDASIDGIEATSAYGKQLLDEGYAVNGIVIVITDGMDNRSTHAGPNDPSAAPADGSFNKGYDPARYVRNALEQGVKGENLESLVSILIAVIEEDANNRSDIATEALRLFNQHAGFTQYIELGDASEKTIARIGGFISESVSSQSQALGTGGPSQSLTF